MAAATNLSTPFKLGKLNLPHRIVMPPMTRARASQPGDVPNDLNATYYGQRASAALIIAEATDISAGAKGYSHTPGIYSDAQVEGWKKVTRAVHEQGGRIYVQLWHVGRMSHPDFHAGRETVAPSSAAFEGRVWKVDPATGMGAMVDSPVPRALTHAEIKEIVQDFAYAARNAIRAGFDGVEIHGANGYLVDQFLRTTSNLREDEYGGNRDNRMRFLLEVVDAVAAEIGAERTAVRLAPFLTQRGMACPDILPTLLEVASRLSERGIAYLHLVEADFDDAPEFTEQYRIDLRLRFPGPIIVAGRYTVEKASLMIEKGYADLAAFGRPFMANPDLPQRLQQGAPLNELDADTLFGGTAKGYTDYPALAGVAPHFPEAALSARSK